MFSDKHAKYRHRKEAGNDKLAPRLMPNST